METVRSATGLRNLPAHVAFMQYGICPLGIISDLSIQMWGLYCATGGTSRITTPREYWNLPALYVAGVQVIDAELARIEKVKSGNKN